MSRYVIAGRLEDVILLLQLLSMDDRQQIYEQTIEQIFDQDLAKPRSEGYDSWADVAAEHPEFFRVSGENLENRAIALLARYLRGGPIPGEYVQMLTNTALEIHDRQVSRKQQSVMYWRPLLVALIAGVFTLIAALLPLTLSH